MDLPALVDFNLVATHGGFGRASRATGRPKATLSRKVSELEASLGVRLIDRGSRTLRLTGEGRALHDRTLGPLTEIIEAEQAVASGASVPAGKLRVSAPIVLAHVLLPKLATGFVAAYPQVDLEILAEDRKVDPVDENYDLVIRIDPSPDERLVGRRILEDERLLVAPPGTSVRSIRSGKLPITLSWRSAALELPTTSCGGSGQTPGLITCNRGSDCVLVLLDGTGCRSRRCGRRPCAEIDGDGGYRRRRLVSLGAHDGPKVEIWTLQNSRRLTSSKVRAFLDMLGSIGIDTS